MGPSPWESSASQAERGAEDGEHHAAGAKGSGGARHEAHWIAKARCGAARIEAGMQVFAVGGLDGDGPEGLGPCVRGIVGQAEEGKPNAAAAGNKLNIGQPSHLRLSRTAKPGP